MARQRITERTLSRTFPSCGDRIEIWDDLLPGFGVRITSRGIKSFFVFTRLHGKPIRVTLGSYPAIDLASARDAARSTLLLAQKGEDPRAIKRAKIGTVDHLIQEFSERHLIKLRPKSATAASALLRGRFLDRFSGRSPADIKRAEIRALLDDIADEGKGTTANRLLAATRKLFGWAVDRGELDFSPCHGLKAPAKEIQRSRFLTMDEVAVVWQASEVASPVYSAFVQMLLLTGQRREAVAQMRHSQISNGIWTIPRESMKGGRAHTVPISNLAKDIIKRIPVYGSSDLVFTHDGRRAVGGFSKMKRQIDAQIGILIGNGDNEASKFAGWRLHDLRRTAGTHIARIGYPRLLVSKILGHAEGGVTQIYELYSYDVEKRRALEAWAAEIEKAITTAKLAPYATRSAVELISV